MVFWKHIGAIHCFDIQRIIRGDNPPFVEHIDDLRKFLRFAGYRRGNRFHEGMVQKSPVGLNIVAVGLAETVTLIVEMLPDLCGVKEKRSFFYFTDPIGRVRG